MLSSQQFQIIENAEMTTVQDTMTIIIICNIMQNETNSL